MQSEPTLATEMDLPPDYCHRDEGCGLARSCLNCPFPRCIYDVPCVKQYQSGQWQTKAAWDKTTGALSGVAAVYDGDWNLLVTGRDNRRQLPAVEPGLRRRRGGGCRRLVRA